jgi:hypothetical protein
MDILRGKAIASLVERLTKFQVGEHKSFADDLNMERGTVSMRVALRYDLLRFSPCSLDLYLIQFITGLHQFDSHQTVVSSSLSQLQPVSTRINPPQHWTCQFNAAVLLIEPPERAQNKKRSALAAGRFLLLSL